MILDVGRVVVKTSGRESGKIAVIVDKINKNFVLIDGDVKRRECNILHLEPLDKKIKIKSNADTKTVIKELSTIGISVKGRKVKAKKTDKKDERKK